MVKQINNLEGKAKYQNSDEMMANFQATYL